MHNNRLHKPMFKKKLIKLQDLIKVQEKVKKQIKVMKPKSWTKK